MHAEHLEAAFGVGPHTISVPRLKHADDINPDDFDNGSMTIHLQDRRLHPHRCSVYRHDHLHQGEPEDKRARPASRHLPDQRRFQDKRGRLLRAEPEDEKSEQFDVSDNRTLDEVVRWLMEMDYIPSFCTACYREGRTGDRFMSLCKSGQIQNCCHPNALMTLKEYLMDYASPETKAIGDKLIEKEVLNVRMRKHGLSYWRI